MRNEPIKIRYLQTGGLKDFVGPFFEHADSKFKNGSAIHVNERRTRHLATVHATGHAKHVLVAAIGMQFRRENAGLVARGYHYSASAVTEQDTGAAIVPVEDARVHFCPDHQHMSGLAGADEQIRNRECVHEAAAHCLHVERRTTCNPELRLKDACRAGKYDVRRRRCDNDEVDIRRIHACRMQRPLRCGQCEVAGQLAFRGDMPAADAGAGSNPFIRGIDRARQIVVGHDFFRQITSRTDYAREHQAAFC